MARDYALPVILLLAAALAGCGELAQLTGKTFHQKVGWKAKDFFHDPQVIALCHAIEADDLKEIDRLVAAGANINAKGKDNMTPLLWAFPDNKLARFTHLLELGADPNVVITADVVKGGGGFGRGESVTHMACQTEFPDYFEAVFAHGGDPKLITNKIITGATTLDAVITGGGPKKKEHVHFLIGCRADVNHMNGAGSTPLMYAANSGRYDIATLLLESGADWRINKPMSNTRLIHIVAMREDRRATWTPEQAADYAKLVKWLEDHGESIEQAKEDIKRWQSWSSKTFRQKMDAEIAEREAREVAEKTAAEKPDQEE